MFIVSKTRKRGQAALEFLMTYGWAILVVLIVIGALAYFGVLNPTIMLPEKCTLQMGMYCKNHLILSDNSVYFELENGMGKGVILRKVNVSGDFINCWADFTIPNNGSSTCSNPFYGDFHGKKGLHIANGKSVIFNITEFPCVGGDTIFTNCTVLSRFGKTKSEIRIRWFYDDANELFTHTMKGELLAAIE